MRKLPLYSHQYDEIVERIKAIEQQQIVASAHSIEYLLVSKYEARSLAALPSDDFYYIMEDLNRYR